jgi:hypothetical protein
VGVPEIDDFQVILERMTTPEQQPVLHFFRTDPDAFHRLDVAAAGSRTPRRADDRGATVAERVRAGVGPGHVR